MTRVRIICESLRDIIDFGLKLTVLFFITLGYPEA